jgi:hypothetical protein
MNRQTLYVAANASFVLLVLGGLVLSGMATSVHPVYLILLFALCSTFILDMTTFNDRYALLAIFSCIYFVYYGLLDLTTLLLGGSGQAGEPGILGESELVILAGGALAQLGYRLACRSARATDFRAARDWPEAMLVLGGAAIWTICTWIMWDFKVHVLIDATLETQARAFGSRSALQLSAFMLAAYLQPLGIVILAYAQCTYRRPYVVFMLVGAILIEMILGVISDSKGQVLIGVVLIAITKLLVDGKIPRTRLVIAIAVVVVVFPILQANRMALGERGSSHTQAAQNFMQTLERAFAATDKVQSGPNRMETIFERSSLKQSVEMIVRSTGRTVPYQNGHTLWPLATVFIPRLIWPDKPGVETGRLVNKVFRVSDQAETNISPSHLGELYWNFGWPGVLIGMAAIGSLLGLLGRRFDLSKTVTLTRVLVLLATVKFIVLGFEGSIEVQYSPWLRVMLAIGLLHVFCARLPVPGKSADTPAPSAGEQAGRLDGTARFPNLIR